MTIIDEKWQRCADLIAAEAFPVAIQERFKMAFYTGFAHGFTLDFVAGGLSELDRERLAEKIHDEITAFVLACKGAE